MAVDAFPKSLASGARRYCERDCSHRGYKGYFVDFLPQQKSLQMQTLQLHNQNTNGVKYDLTLRRSNTCSASAEGQDGLGQSWPLPVVPSSVTSIRSASAPLQWLPELIQVWHVTCFQRSGLFVLKIIVSLTTTASSTFNVISAVASNWQLEQKSTKYSRPNHMTGLYKVFAAFLVASDQP